MPNPRITTIVKRIITLAAIAAATAASAAGIAGAWGSSGIAGAAPSAGSGSASGSKPNADQLAAQIAVTHKSATLDQFSLIHLHHIPPLTTAAPAAAGTTSSTSPGVLSNPDEQMLTSQARPLNRSLAPSRASASPCSEICSGGPAPSTASTGPGSEVIDNGGYGSPKAPATIVRVTTPRGFDWDDAGIGAAGGLGLALSALGVALAVSQRRARRSKEPTAVTS